MISRNGSYETIRRHLPLALALGSILLLVLIATLLDFSGVYGQDSHEYYRYSKAWFTFLSGGPHPGDYFWPVNYPFIGALFTFVTGSNLLALQLMSMVSYGFTIYYLFHFLALFYPAADGRSRGAFLVLLYAPAPYFFQSGLLVMSDMSATFCTTAAIYHALRYYYRGDGGHFLLAAFLAGAAIMFRYATALPLFPALLMMTIRAVRQRELRLVMAALLLGLLPALPHLYIRMGDSAQFLAHEHIDTWSVLNWFRRSFSNQQGEWHYRFPNIAYAFGIFFHPGFLFTGVLLFPFAKRDTWPNRLWLPIGGTILLYGLFLAGIPFQNTRYPLPVFPLGALFMFPLFERCRQRFFNRPSLGILAAAAILTIQGALILKYSRSTVTTHWMEKEIAARLQPYQQPIYTFWIDGALRNYGVDNAITNLWMHEVSEADSGTLLLFHPQKFSAQWEGHTPMRNWEFLNTNYRLTLREQLTGGWQLYEIGARREPAQTDDMQRP